MQSVLLTKIVQRNGRREIQNLFNVEAAPTLFFLLEVHRFENPCCSFRWASVPAAVVVFCVSATFACVSFSV
jgi:hypothetical protein